jgi:hypothetical protein
MPLMEERCEPCDDGRRLLIAAVVARLAWGLATRRLAGDTAVTSLAPWAALAASSLAPVLAYRLAINLRLTRAAALAAGFLLAVLPSLVDAGTLTARAAALPTLTAACLVAWIYAWQSGRITAAALAGLCGGAAAWAGAAVVPVAAALALVAALRRREQPRWAALAATALIAGALIAAVRPASRVESSTVPNKWSVAMAVTPTPGRDLRVLEIAVGAVLFAAAFFGLRSVASGPGGWFVLAWLAAAAFARSRSGAWSGIGEDPVAAVLAGAGFRALGFLSDR